MQLSIHIQKNQDGRYLVSSPSLPGCRAVGKSFSDAQDNFLLAARGYLAAMNNFVPEALQARIETLPACPSASLTVNGRI